VLRCPESKPEARQQLQAALVRTKADSDPLTMAPLSSIIFFPSFFCISQERLPVIMASDPPDALDLCLPLTKELLTVSNAYNISVCQLAPCLRYVRWWFALCLE
jgi:hypothetical protein